MNCSGKFLLTLVFCAALANLVLRPPLCHAQQSGRIITSGSAKKGTSNSGTPNTGTSTTTGTADKSAAKNEKTTYLNLDALPAPGAKRDDTKKEISFDNVPIGMVGFAVIPIPLQKGNPLLSIHIKDDNSDPSTVFMDEAGDQCSTAPNPDALQGGVCYVLVGFAPTDKGSFSATLTIQDWNRNITPWTLKGQGTAPAPCQGPAAAWLPLTRRLTVGPIYPLAPNVNSNAMTTPATTTPATTTPATTTPATTTPATTTAATTTPATTTPAISYEDTQKLATNLYQDFGDPIRRSLVNCYYSSNSMVSYFNQLQSIYNSAAGAATASVNIVSLNFMDGIQLTVASNPQISTSSATSPPSNPGAGTPTLSATGAAQAAQNIINGGTFIAQGRYPVFDWGKGTAHTFLSMRVQEGVDLQKFNNTSITSTNPSDHTFVGLDGYLQFNSSNNAASSNSPAGTIFFSGAYGYARTTHQYSLENGFGGRVHDQLGQVGAGVLITAVAKIAAYRGFGPRQVYIDSANMNQTTVNNFKSWSFAISYQSKAK